MLVHHISSVIFVVSAIVVHGKYYKKKFFEEKDERYALMYTYLDNTVRYINNLYIVIHEQIKTL